MKLPPPGRKVSTRARVWSGTGTRTGGSGGSVLQAATQERLCVVVVSTAAGKVGEVTPLAMNRGTTPTSRSLPAGIVGEPGTP